MNEEELDKLVGQVQRFRSHDEGGFDIDGRKIDWKRATELLNDRMLWPNKSALKIGCQVMLLIVRLLLARGTLLIGRKESAWPGAGQRLAR